MNGFKAEPLSRKDICDAVHDIRKMVDLEDEPYFPIVQFLENVLPEFISNFQLEIVPEYELPSAYGETFPSKGIVRLREDTYIQAANDDKRSRFTVAHEIGHLLLHDNDFVSLTRLDAKQNIKPYEDPEWQANVFAAEMLAPTYIIKGMSCKRISSLCGISYQAAAIQMKYCGNNGNNFERRNAY